MRVIQRVWKDIRHGENIDLYLSLVVSIILGTLNLLGSAPPEWVTSITLFVLGLLALSTLVNRDRFERLEDKLTQANQNLEKDINNLGATLSKIGHGQATAASFFQTRPERSLPAMLQGARTLDMIGTTLLSMAITNQALLRGLKESGARVRLLVSNPNNRPLQQIYALRFLEVEAPTQHATTVRTALKNFETLMGNSASGGSVEVRTTDRDISFSYVGTDTAYPTGRISIEMYLTKVPLNDNPIFTLDADTDPHWYNRFREQFEVLWGYAETLQS